MNAKAYTIIEILISTTAALVLILVVYNFYATTKGIYVSGIAGQAIQDGCHLVLAKIIEGKTEPGGTYRLQEAVSYTIPSISELHWTATDGIERWYKLNGSLTQVIYHHPTSGGTADEVIYTAPSGATITLRFWIPNVANYSAAVVGIDVAISQTISGKTINGASSTIVNLRNHPV